MESSHDSISDHDFNKIVGITDGSELEVVHIKDWLFFALVCNKFSGTLFLLIYAVFYVITGNGRT